MPAASGTVGVGGSGLAAKANVTARKAASNNKAHILPARTTDIQTTHDKSLYRGC